MSGSVAPLLTVYACVLPSIAVFTPDVFLAPFFLARDSLPEQLSITTYSQLS